VTINEILTLSNVLVTQNQHLVGDLQAPAFDASKEPLTKRGIVPGGGSKSWVYRIFEEWTLFKAADRRALLIPKSWIRVSSSA
jgi:hypothetical protein